MYVSPRLFITSQHSKYNAFDKDILRFFLFKAPLTNQLTAKESDL